MYPQAYSCATAKQKETAQIGQLWICHSYFLSVEQLGAEAKPIRTLHLKDETDLSQ